MGFALNSCFPSWSLVFVAVVGRVCLHDQPPNKTGALSVCQACLGGTEPYELSAVCYTICCWRSCVLHGSQERVFGNLCLFLPVSFHCNKPQPWILNHVSLPRKHWTWDGFGDPDILGKKGRVGRSWGESWQTAKCLQILNFTTAQTSASRNSPHHLVVSNFLLSLINSLVIQNKCSRLSPMTQLSLSSEMGEIGQGLVMRKSWIH